MGSPRSERPWTAMSPGLSMMRMSSSSQSTLRRGPAGAKPPSFPSPTSTLKTSPARTESSVFAGRPLRRTAPSLCFSLVTSPAERPS